MREHFILQIVLDMAGHYDQRLSDKVKKHTPQECHEKDQPCIHHDAEGKHMKKILETNSGNRLA